MNTPNQLQQEMFQNDIHALVSILNANNVSKELCNVINDKIAQRVAMYFSPTITTSTEV